MRRQPDSVDINTTSGWMHSRNSEHQLIDGEGAGFMLEDMVNRVARLDGTSTKAWIVIVANTDRLTVRSEPLCHFSSHSNPYIFKP